MKCRLLVSTSPDEHAHRQFTSLSEFLDPKDLLVVNQSATLPAALDATGPPGGFLLDLCTDYGNGLWLTEPRESTSTPGPLSLAPGDSIEAGGLRGRVVGSFPQLEWLVFVRFEGDVRAALEAHGRPIRYGYVEKPFPLEAYQTYFAAEAGSAEMPSAARPFTERVVTRLQADGIGIASLTLHTGVSSLEIQHKQYRHHVSDLADNLLYPEPFRVPRATVQAVNRTRRRGGRVIAVGTTVVRALESALVSNEEQVRETAGFTRRFITPHSGVSIVDALLTGLHDPETTHLLMLYAIAGRELVMNGYKAAIENEYLWHELGDTHLLLP